MGISARNINEEFRWILEMEHTHTHSLIFLTPSHCTTVSASLLYINHDRYLIQPTYGGNDL